MLADCKNLPRREAIASKVRSELGGVDVIDGMVMRVEHLFDQDSDLKAIPHSATVSYLPEDYGLAGKNDFDMGTLRQVDRNSYPKTRFGDIQHGSGQAWANCV